MPCRIGDGKQTPIDLIGFLQSLVELLDDFIPSGFGSCIFRLYRSKGAGSFSMNASREANNGVVKIGFPLDLMIGDFGSQFLICLDQLVQDSLKFPRAGPEVIRQSGHLPGASREQNGYAYWMTLWVAFGVLVERANDGIAFPTDNVVSQEIEQCCLVTVRFIHGC